MTVTDRLRGVVHRQLHPEAWPSGGVSPLNRAVVALVLVSVAVTVVQTEPRIGARAQAGLAMVERALGAVFVLEYAARVWTAPLARPWLAPWRARFGYVFSVWGLIDLLAILPVFIGAAGGEAFILRLARVLRILRLARLGRFSRALARLGGALMARRFDFAVTLAFGGALTLVAATLLYLAEGAAQPEAFGSIPRALWWAVVTLTTLGYGDVTPVTGLGKALAALTAVIGIGVIAMPAGIVAAALGEALRADRGRGGERD
jgi:voltage-gated potassium channel